MKYLGCVCVFLYEQWKLRVKPHSCFEWRCIISQISSNVYAIVSFLNCYAVWENFYLDNALYAQLFRGIFAFIAKMYPK